MYLSPLRLDGVSIGRGVRIHGDAVHLAIIDECRDIAELEQLIASHIAPMFTTTNGKLVMISTAPSCRRIRSPISSSAKRSSATTSIRRPTYRIRCSAPSGCAI